MIDKDKPFLEQLENLINQTYIVEREYRTLTLAYQQLQKSVEEIAETLPNPLWVLNELGEVVVTNSKAEEISEILKLVDLSKGDSEIEFGGLFYLVKVAKYQHKIVVVATDTTEHKRKERLITMGQMAAHLSHEIRNPTASIALLTSSLIKKADGVEKEVLFEIEKSVFRIERIIQTTLLYSKGVFIEKKEVELSQVESEIRDSINYYSYSKEIDFIFRFPDKRIFGDREMLVILFTNFVFNAIDAIEADDNDSGTVKILYSEDSNFHKFEIYDSGIPFESSDTLFEPFKTTKKRGNGLGLVLSQQIAQSHGGDIEVVNSRREKGFLIYLEK
jgi:two-component system NtrC family sensor kinase